MSTKVFPDYRIFTDATADLSRTMLDGLPPAEIIPMAVEIGGQPYTYGPGGNLTISRFYQMQREGQFATTSQINPAVYEKAFEKALKSGYDVLYLGFSSGMSGTINAARVCMRELQGRYPARKLICIDTLCASVGEGFLVHEALKKQAEGMPVLELSEWVMARRQQVCHWFTVDTFEHLRHGGRVSAAAAAMGSMLNIKPLLHVDWEGKLAVAQKPRGSKRAMRLQLEMLQQGWWNELGRYIVIGHGDNPEGAATLSAMVHDRFPEAEIAISEIGPIIGAHTGPGMLAVIYWGENR